MRKTDNKENRIESGIRSRESRERTRGIHLLMLIMLTLTVPAVSGTGYLLGWELWLLPFLFAGVGFCWFMHIRQLFTERMRLYLIAIVIWSVLIYHGTHLTSFMDLAALAAIEFALFALTDEVRLVDIGFLVFWFCFFWDLFHALTGDMYVFDTLMMTRIELYIAVVVFTYFIARHIIRTRKAVQKEDERVIDAMTTARARTEAFLVNISRAFRTPVNVVNGITAAGFAQETDEAKKEQMKYVLDAGGDLSGKLEDLLDYTELQTGRFVPSTEPYTIAPVIGDVLKALRLYARADLHVIVDVDATIPRVIRGDFRRVRMVLYHLLDNALKATREGGVYVHVYRMPHDDGFNLCIEVRDTGRGMTREELSNIREGIYLAEGGEAHLSEGFGLGLPIVYGIVHTMGGFVRMESEAGEGTRVHASIPQQAAEEGTCMEVKHPGRLKCALYQRPDKFTVPAVRDYYQMMVMSLIRTFKLKLERVLTLSDLKELLETNTFTHVFTADGEYAEDPAFFDALAKKTHVIVVAAAGFEPQPGSRVTILRKPFCTIPLTETLNAETEADAKEALRAAEPVRFDNKRALVVDDEDMNLVVACRLLSAYGIKADAAHTGEEALEKALNNRYDVIFLEHMMPDLDGITCAHRIRSMLQAEGRRVKTVALTADAGSGARERFARAGFDGFVSKPVAQGELVRELQLVLEEHG